MEKKIGQRIKELRLKYNMGIKEFGMRCGLSHVAIFHLENGKTLRPQKSSIQRIVSVFGTTNDWLMYSIGDMLPNGMKDLDAEEKTVENYWKEEAYLELKNRNSLLEKEVERLWQIVGHFANDTRALQRAYEN